MKEERRWPHRRAAAAIFALLFGIYLFTASGHTYAVDEELMLATTQNLLTQGTFAVSAGGPDTPPSYSGYGPAQSIAAIPFYLVGRGLATFFPEHGSTFLVRAVLSWYNPFVTAGVAALVYAAAVLLRFSPRVAVATALLYGLATTAWPHSKTFFSEPLTALVLFGSFVLALMVAHDTSRAYEMVDAPRRRTRDAAILFASGASAGIAPIVKIQAGVVLPLLGLFVAWIVLRAHGFGWPGLRRLVAWGAGAFGVLGLLAVYQWLAFGAVGRTGYGSAGRLFQHDFLAGLYGLVLSPGKGIVWYAPPLLLWPVAAWLFWKRSRAAAVLCAAVAAGNLLFYAPLNFWHGDGAWGPRYLNIILPFFVLPLAAFLEGLTRWRAAALVLTLLLAGPVQFGALAININAYLNLQTDSERRYFNPPDSPIAQHLALVGRQLRQVYNMYLAPNSVVLRHGFSYSQGDRDRGEQVPRWTLPHAEIVVRPPAGQTLGLDLTVNGCRPNGAPSRLALRHDALGMLVDDACPPRTFHLLLPARRSRLLLDAAPYDPALGGIDMQGPLGVVLMDLAANVDGRSLAIQGDLIPVTSIPSGSVALRRWAGDHRFGHWDFWWWYLAHASFPPRRALVLSIGWVVVSLAFFLWGWRELWGLHGKRDRAVV